VYFGQNELIAALTKVPAMLLFPPNAPATPAIASL
jgi:hypothetical protein